MYGRKVLCAGPGPHQFRELTDKALRRGVFRSVPDLTEAIEAHIEASNEDPKPLIGTATHLDRNG